MKILWAVSSVGKGHVIRDLAIISQIKKIESEVEINWIAPYPAAEYLKKRGQKVLDCSDKLLGSGKIYESVFKDCSKEFNLFKYIAADTKVHKHDFIESMAAIDSNNYDLIVGDEAFWLLSGFGTEKKRSIPFIFITDFIGMNVMRFSIYHSILSWWFNFKFSMSFMIPDQYIYIGFNREIPSERFGVFLPNKRKWAEQHCTFVKPIVPLKNEQISDKDELKKELGFSESQSLIISVIGPEGDYRKRVTKIEGVFEILRDSFENGVFIIVSPYIGNIKWITYYNNLDNLYKYFKISDFAIIQSGYGKIAELSSLGIPFIAVPLDFHFEQEYLMKHRLNLYSTGELVTFRNNTAEDIAKIATNLMGKDIKKIEADNGEEVARLIVERLHLPTASTRSGC